LAGIVRIVKSKRMMWARYVAPMGRRGMHILVKKARTKETIRRPRRRLVDDIETYVT
jgi:hypothetical protein